MTSIHGIQCPFSPPPLTRKVFYFKVRLCARFIRTCSLLNYEGIKKWVKVGKSAQSVARLLGFTSALLFASCVTLGKLFYFFSVLGFLICWK